MFTKKENEYEAQYLTKEDELRPSCSKKNNPSKENEYEVKREEGVAAD